MPLVTYNLENRLMTTKYKKIKKDLIAIKLNGHNIHVSFESNMYACALLHIYYNNP